MTQRRKKTPQNIIPSLLFLISLFIIIAFLIISNWRINERRVEYTERINQFSQETKALEDRNRELKAGVTETSQLDYTEKVLREKGLYKKKGEEMIIIIPPEKEEERVEEEEKSIWEKILGKIKLRD